MLLFELFKSGVEYEFSEEDSHGSEEMVWKFTTPKGVDYEVLIQRMYNDPVDVYYVEFSNESAQGRLRHKKTGTGEELVVFATVMDVLMDFASAHTGIYVFSSDAANRTKLYARMAGKHVPAPFVVDVGSKDEKGNDVFYIGMPNDIAEHKAAHVPQQQA